MHIGKSSVGWVFSLHVEPDDPNFPSNLEDWKKLFEKFPNGISSEYCESLSADEMIAHIVNKSHNGTGYLGTVVSACATYGVSYLTLEMESGLRMTFEERSVKPV